MGQKYLSDGRARVFAVAADLGDGDQFALHQVLTWREVEDAEAFLTAGQTERGKEVVLGERGGVVTGGMSAAVGSEEGWLVKLGQDRSIPPVPVGGVLTLLESEWHGGAGAALWRVEARVAGYLQATPEGVRRVALHE